MVTGTGVTWLIRRLTVMSPAEISHRIGVAIRRAGDGLGAKLTGRNPGAVSRPVSSFAFMVSDRPVLPCPPMADIDWSVAHDLLAGNIPVFGHEASWSDDPAFWHTDPLTGAVWPRTPGQRLSYRPGNPTGDARIVWELNRLQHLVDLAVVAEKWPDKRAAVGALVVRQLASWYRANPYPHGINHLSAMEHGLRSIAVLHAFDLLRPSFDGDARQSLLDLVLRHAWHIERHLSLYSSAGNHTIAEAAGLLYVGALFPEHPAAARWTSIARRLLDTEGDRQVRADGGPLEQATWYLLFITDLMGLARNLLAHTGQPPLPGMDAAVDRALQFLGGLARTPDELPRIGDADDGFALSRHLRVLWNHVEPVRGHREYPATGLTAVSFDGHDRLLFLHNDLGMPPSYGHGHSDALSILFRWGNQDVLLDPGTYLYGGPPELRRYFRSASAHNTLTIGGRDQATQTAPFMWSNPYRSRCVFSRLEGDVFSALATHDGYRHSGHTVWRGIVYRRNRFLAVWDHVRGGTDVPVTLHWHLGGDVTPNFLSGTGLVRLPDGQTLRMTNPPGKCSIDSASPAPPGGWQSACYGSLSPCQMLTLELPEAAPEALTIFRLDESAKPDEELDAWLDEFRNQAKR